VLHLQKNMGWGRMVDRINGLGCIKKLKLFIRI